MKFMERVRAAGKILRAKESPAAGIAVGTSQLRDGNRLGPWNGIYDWFVPRQVNPNLYEAMREALSPIDGGINRLVTMDGIIAVEGENDAIVQEIDTWMRNVRVNDMETGFQAFKDGLGNETYEQGFGIGEFIADAKGRDIIALRVADSKGVCFRRTAEKFEGYYRAPARTSGRGDGTDRVEQILRNSYGVMSTGDLADAGFTPLNLNACVYQSIHNEADNPYGTSIMRSMEFVARILLTIENATEQTWNRFGDPPLSVTYKTKNRSLKPADLEARKTTIATSLATTLAAKRSGNSAEFVQAIGADDELTISVIGAQDKIIEIEMPARHMLEQIVAKLGLPSWMLGYHWSTAERLAESQGIIVLQESNTRWARSEPTYTRVVRTMLQLRGRTWKPKDWQLVQRLPNLADELKRAQAEFLRAQTQLMLSGALNPNNPAADGDSAPAKQLRHAIDSMSAKLVGMDSDARRNLMADPTAIDNLVNEALGW